MVFSHFLHHGAIVNVLDENAAVSLLKEGLKRGKVLCLTDAGQRKAESWFVATHINAEGFLSIFDPSSPSLREYAPRFSPEEIQLFQEADDGEDWQMSLSVLEAQLGAFPLKESGFPELFRQALGEPSECPFLSPCFPSQIPQFYRPVLESQTETGESWQDVTRQSYPSVSAWLADMERDPDLARLWVGRGNYPNLQAMLAQWITDGRPLIAWQETSEAHPLKLP